MLIKIKNQHLEKPKHLNNSWAKTNTIITHLLHTHTHATKWMLNINKKKIAWKGIKNITSKYKKSSTSMSRPEWELLLGGNRFPLCGSSHHQHHHLSSSMPPAVYYYSWFWLSIFAFAFLSKYWHFIYQKFDIDRRWWNHKPPSPLKC